MGIDFAGLSQILDVFAKIDRKGSLLMLGRQGLHFDLDRIRRAADEKLAAIDPSITIDSLLAKSSYAEPLFHALGVKTVESLDYSAYENADIVHDMNEPIPAHLHGKYDIVLDGGTLEHVFDVKTAMTNAYNLVAPGGTFIGISPGNNFFAHGFYQFSPDLVFSFWKRGMGCEILDCVFRPEFPRDKAWQIEDPYDTKRRVVMRGKQVAQRTYLTYAARKPVAAASGGKVLQGDYTHLWRDTTGEG